jgi:hypothetical protein
VIAGGMYLLVRYVLPVPAGYVRVLPDWPLWWLALAVLSFLLALPGELARTYRLRRAERAARESGATPSSASHLTSSRP